jgi:hypothetical protein
MKVYIQVTDVSLARAIIQLAVKNLSHTYKEGFATDSNMANLYKDDVHEYVGIERSGRMSGIYL